MIKWNNLQELLKESKSKSKLSKATGISTGNISDWFNPDKKAQPSADALVKMAEYFNCSVDYLLDRTETTNTYSEKVIHLIDMGEIIHIDTHTQPVSAGKGSNICVDDQAIPCLYPATNISDKADYCVRISGDSMYPEYLNGDIVYVSKKEKPKHNDIGIFLYNDEAYCKKYYENDGIKKLLSLNPDQERHKPITIENDSFVTQEKLLASFILIEWWLLSITKGENAYMSLIMSLETYEGIVMTADRLSTVSYLNEKTNTMDAFPKTYNSYKLFLMKNGYGISECGNGKFSNGSLSEQFLLEEICTKDFINQAPEEIAKYILNYYHKNNMDTILLFCGYYDSKSFTIEINGKRNELYNYPNSSKNKVVRYGDTSIADALLDSKFYYGYSTYRLQDAVNLLKYVNEVTAKFQQFQEVLQTVSEECDILVLYKNGKQIWLNKNELHI